MEKLPDEVLEHILDFLPPYHDLENCKLVCKRWRHVVSRLVGRKKNSLISAIKGNRLIWGSEPSLPGMAYRHSLASCYHDGAMYIYGGFSDQSTTFNDWSTFNLTTRKWHRIISSGQFPSPKGAASLCAYKNKLILLGGCAPPSRMIPFQPVIIFDELHVFDTKTTTWKKYDCGTLPVTNHSVTVHGNVMVTFGGLSSVRGTELMLNDGLRCLNLDSMTWSTPKVLSQKPPPMYGQSQIYIDDTHLLILGGQDKEAMPHHGTWLLTMGEEPWQWSFILEENPQWSPPSLCYHPVVRIEDTLIAFNGVGEDEEESPQQPEAAYERNGGPIEKNVNGKRGSFRLMEEVENEVNAGAGPSNALQRNERCKRRLSHLQNFEMKYMKEKEKPSPPPKIKAPSMNLYMGDIADIVTTGRMTWLEPKYFVGGPYDRCLYSLVVGRAELILLGGFVERKRVGRTIIIFPWPKPKTQNMYVGRAPRAVF